MREGQISVLVISRDLSDKVHRSSSEEPCKTDRLEASLTKCEQPEDEEQQSAREWLCMPSAFILSFQLWLVLHQVQREYTALAAKALFPGAKIVV